MIRIIVDMPYENGKRFIKAAGLSTDNKPTDGIITGSKFLEVDYGVERIFDEENGVWDFFQGDVDIQSFTATANATYNAPYGKAYNKVIVDVPNTYTAGDEGKVVSDGALVAQTAHAEVTENGTIDTTLNNSVTVNVSFSGVAASDVNFYDYDGTIVASYSAADFANLTALPANPSHDGLTAQGWNWSLADAKTYVASYGRLEIGQMYITTDGKTHVHIHLEQGRTSPMLGCCPNGTVDVDWGDGTTHDTLTGTDTTVVQWTPTHNYAAPGDYVIKLTVTGSMEFYGSSSTNEYSGLLRYTSSGDGRNYVYRNAIQKVEIGSNVTSIGNYAFQNCYGLANITIPEGATSIGNYAFSNCYSFASVTIPDGATSIGNYAFQNCYNLASVTISDSVTSIGNYAFVACYNLASVTISDSVTSIVGNTFLSCYGLASVTIPEGVTSIDDSAFLSCYGLASVTIPDGVTSIGSSAFLSCYNLASVTISDSVTSIGGSAFLGCYSLASVTIPEGVTSIGSNAFVNCYSVAEYHLVRTTPPTLGSSAFIAISADCIIYVPYSADHSILEAYKTASNWSTYASYMQEEPQ